MNAGDPARHKVLTRRKNKRMGRRGSRRRRGRRWRRRWRRKGEKEEKEGDEIPYELVSHGCKWEVMEGAPL